MEKHPGCKIAKNCDGNCYKSYLDKLNSDIENKTISDAINRNDEFFGLRKKASGLGCDIAKHEDRDFKDAVEGLWRAVVQECGNKKL